MSLLKKLAEDDNAQPTSHDPEAIENEFSSDDETSSADGLNLNNGRSHYVDSDRSHLRASKAVDLGPKYSGTAISRDVFSRALVADLGDSDMSSGPLSMRVDASLGLLGDSRGSSPQNSGYGSNADTNPAHQTESASDQSSDASISITDEIEDGLSSDSDSKADSPKPLQSAKGSHPKTVSRGGGDRAALQNIAQRHEDELRQTLSDAAQADAGKGKAINAQRSTFSSLLATRMGLQKGLTAANSLPMITAQDGVDTASEDHRDVIEAAEKAAESLLESIAALQEAFLPSSAKIRGVKRSFDVHARQSLETSFESLQTSNSEMEDRRRSVVNRWAQKTASTSNQAGADRLRTRSVQQPPANLLDAELSSSSSLDRLVSRSRTPRSCAPLHAKERSVEDDSIYDDADWYAILLRELVEGRTSSGRSNAYEKDLPTIAKVNALRRENKVHRVNVDIKASKGRKLKFTVQEKIQNFLAPDDRNTWGDKQVTELFGSLMGHRIRGGLSEKHNISDEDTKSRGHDTKAGALRLFEAR